MTAILAGAMLLSPLVDPVPMQISTGWWSQYGKQPTDGQRLYAIEHYGIPADWRGALVAVPGCDDVGDLVWVDAGAGWEPAYIFDCSGHTKTTEWMRKERILGELDYYTAARFGKVGRGGWSGRMAQVAGGKG